MKARVIKPDDVCHYRCTKCQHTFSLPSPPTSGTDCPSCGNLYVKWTNYNELTKPVSSQ